MAFSNLLRSLGLSNQQVSETTIPAGFEPLDDEQMVRMQGGFETEGGLEDEYLEVEEDDNYAGELPDGTEEVEEEDDWEIGG